MSQNSPIEWTEATWNPVRGCTKVSPGCANCYAETFAERWRGVKGHPYEQGFDLRLVPDKLEEPLRRNKPTTYFVNSMSDLFQDGVSDDYIDRVFAVMALTPQHTYQVLTKRAERMRAYLQGNAPWRWTRHMPNIGVKALDRWDREYHAHALDNVWLGVSVENQHFADERIPLLLQTPAAVRFISAEPLLGPVDLTGDPDPCRTWLRSGISTARGVMLDKWQPPLDWVIVGGESGAGARRFDVEWARAIVQQCNAAGVACFVKQLGRDLVSWKHPKGGDPAEWPADLRVRQFPESRA